MAAERTKKPPLLRRLLSARGRNLEITKAGWLFILLTLAVGFAAINSGSNLLHVVFGCQIGLIVASGVLSESMVQRAQVARTVESSMHAGAPAALRVQLRNDARRGDLLAVSVEDDDQKTGWGTTRPVFSLALNAGKSATLGSQVVMPRRGKHRLPPAVVATRFPFGLFIKRRELPRGAEILVYPTVKPIELRGPDLSRTGDGESAAGIVARTGEFLGLREYREGDDLHRIHWPATARLSKTVVSEYESQGLSEHWVDLEPGVTGTDRFEARVEEAASLAVAHLRRAQRAVGLRYGGEIIVAPGLGPHQEQRILGFLAVAGSEAAA
jgi:uncharacterized protein (DUF58 family)